MNDVLYLACESGRIVGFNTRSCEYYTVYQDPSQETMMGLIIDGETLYFGGKTFLGLATVAQKSFSLESRIEFNSFSPRKAIASLVYRLDRFGPFTWFIKERSPAFHQMNLYGSQIYLSVTGCNEVWVINKKLDLIRRIAVHPHLPDYNHLNNVFADSQHFYVCLNRYDKKYGYGGFAKFDADWNELGRFRLGWEVHAFSIIDGQTYNLCGSSQEAKPGIQMHHPHGAGLMVDGRLVFEHAPGKFFCKDFSMDDEFIYVVGGEVAKRHNRKQAAGVIFILNHKFELVHTQILPAVGGICGCRLPDLDYTNGHRSNE